MEPIIPRHHSRGRFWFVAVAAVLGMAATASLGWWQLGRAAQKNALQAELDERAQLPVLTGEQLVAQSGESMNADALVQRAVQLQGHWLPQHTVYLDNRQMRGRPGFFVVTPLQLEGSGKVILVQRGWAPRDFHERTTLPPVQSAEGLVHLEGRVALAPSRLYEFNGAHEQPGDSRIRQNLDLNAFRKETRLPLAALTVLQTGDPSDGLVRDWPVITTGVDKHYGYAFQWFGLCGLIALLYVWFQFVRRNGRPSGSGLS